MARTKRTPQHPILDCGSVTVINSYPLSFYIYVGVKVMYQGKEEPRELEQVLIDHGTNTIPLKCNDPRILSKNKENNKILSWFLGTNQYGVLWRTTQQEDDTTISWQESVEFHDEFYVSDQWILNGIIPSSTYYLDNDPQNMPLTQQQFNIIHKLVLKQMQKVTPYSQLWSQIRQQLMMITDEKTDSNNNSFFGGPSLIPQNLQDAYDCYNRNFQRTRLPNWQNQYPLFELKAAVAAPAASASASTNAQQANFLKALALDGIGGRARIDVYWRALDRQPGGNNDCHTVCYTFNCSNQTVSTRTVTNWDGSLSRLEYTPITLSKTIQQNLKKEGDPFKSDNDAGNKNDAYANFLTTLRSLGPGDYECTVLETIADDPDAYDTAWSSHEILVFLPKLWTTNTHLQFPKSYQQSVIQFLLLNQRLSPNLLLPKPIIDTIFQFAAPLIWEDDAPILRLHQRCVYGTQWRWYEDLSNYLKVEKPPTPAQQRVLTATKELIGMGSRVNTWSDAGDGQQPCKAFKDKPNDHQNNQCEYWEDDSSSDGFCCTLHPFYFDFPAQNAVPVEITSSCLTSAKVWTHKQHPSSKLLERKRSREEEEESHFGV